MSVLICHSDQFSSLQEYFGLPDLILIFTVPLTPYSLTQLTQEPMTAIAECLQNV